MKTYVELAKEVQARYRELRIVCHENKAENIIKQEFSISENELDDLLDYEPRRPLSHKQF